ncbi:DMT family transporter [Pseudonocardia humida]|uniref:DMT family transporter n=1 Tax=Pseudonocardia humida TaxID=2800819 RepID=A0ABT1ABR7_9PSEU|nr:DMT family transporter [Pseudonocardia humida]MCO1660378.1 DMT family transporter [Pseudonocardia humida]
MPVPAAADPALGVSLALGAAVVFGLGSAAQQRVVARVRADAALVREPQWTAGVAAVGVGTALQLTALAFAPVALVQPLGVTSVLVAASAARHRLDRTSVLGAVACAGGLAGFLLLARPGPALPGAVATEGAGALAVLLVVALVVALVAARHSTGEVRAVALGVAAGACYGISAGLLTVVVAQVRLGGLAAASVHPALYAAAVVGPAGFVLSQHAFRGARSAAPVLAVLTTVDPLVAVAVGVWWLGERIVATPVALAGEALAALAVLGGVVAVARGGARRAVVPA